MSLSIYRIKKWAKMLTGKSALHVNQNEGKCYSIDSIRGYYNDLTEKVLLYGVPHGQVPVYPNEKGTMIEFSIGVFQYGLACYDLFLLNDDELMLSDALLCADWAINHQNSMGAWDTFGSDNPDAPYSSMAQGEALSLLCRAYLATDDQKYLMAAKSAYDFLCTTRSNGGVCDYEDDKMYLYEFTNRPIVFNGAIFSYWGMRDFYLLTKDIEVKKKVEMAEKGLESIIDKIDNGYWSKYDIDKRIASPFYHNLHIAQMRVMYKLTNKDIYSTLTDSLLKYKRSQINKLRSFTKKVWQKVTE